MILVTGAGGQLGARIVDELRARSTQVVGGSRTPATGGRRVDFDDPDTLDLRGISTLVLVSAGYGEDDIVIGRHARVLDAAERDEVGHVVYTSLAGGGDHLGFALAHRATERYLRDRGFGWTILRNGLYAELFGALLTWIDGDLASPFGTGALAAVTRADLAAAAAQVTADPQPHRGATYDLVGETAITVADVAQRLGAGHRTLGLGDYRAGLLAASGLLPFQPPMLASIATAVRHGFLGDTGTDLRTLLGRPLTDALAVASDVAAAGRPSLV